MKVIIDPGWTLTEVVEAAYAAYRGSGVASTGYRMIVVKAWANVVGRRRALAGLHQLVREQGSVGAAASWMGVSTSTFRSVRRHIEVVPDHAVVAPGAPTAASLDDLAFEKRLGGGAAGHVWRARDALGRLVAVKFMYPDDPDGQNVAVHQATVLAKAGGHPNLVQIYYCRVLPHPDTALRHVGIVMEYIEGQPLRERLRRTITREQARTIGTSVADAVAYIHARGMVHGDLHADNVLVTPDDQAKVIDLLNVHGLRTLTSGEQRLGAVGDVEDLKAFLVELASAAAVEDRALADRHEWKAAGTAVQARAEFVQVLERGPVDVESRTALDPRLEILGSWNRIEHRLREAAPGTTATRKGAITMILNQVAERAEIPDELIQRLDRLRMLRNEVAHGVSSDIAPAMAAWALETERLLRKWLDVHP